MSLAPGVRLGAYEIIALVGAGGMGEIYRACDTRLDRPYDVSPVGSRFLMFKPAPPPPISVVLNWAQTLTPRRP